MNKIAILGPGLLGGSLALAVRARLPQTRIGVWARRQSAIEEVDAAGIADVASTDLAAVVENADLIVFCVPIGAMPGLARQLVPLIKPQTLITDVGSVKGSVAEAMVPIFHDCGKFLGSHPMAGSEQAGLSAARADLFAGSVCILTPHPGVDPETVEVLSRFWTQVGCRTSLLSPAEHDQSVGLVSHLPHLVAAALVDFICAANPDSINFCGSGLRDTTRIASGPPEMWTEIFAYNRQALTGQLDGLISCLQNVSRNLAAGNDSNIKKLLADAKSQRDRLKSS